jgi:hypothetical protein
MSGERGFDDAPTEEDGVYMEDAADEVESEAHSFPPGGADDPITIDEAFALVNRLQPNVERKDAMVAMNRHAKRFSSKLNREEQIETRCVLTRARPALRPGTPGNEPHRALTPLEIVLLANLRPRDGDEAVELVPTLEDLAMLGDLGPDMLDTLVKKIK